MKFKQEKFYLSSTHRVSPHEIEYGHVIQLANGSFIEIDDIDTFFADEESEEETLQNTKYTFYGCDGRDIEEIPYNAEFTVFTPLSPVDKQFIDVSKIEADHKKVVDAWEEVSKIWELKWPKIVIEHT